MSPDQERRLEELFSAARDLPPQERSAFLDRACGGDAELRRGADSLFEAHEQAGQFLQPTVNLLAASAPFEKPGDRIGRYKLLEQIGEGGFGVVWMAEQEEPVRRRVALKIIKLGMDTKEVVARFEAERQALAMMDHPNIARVFDGGATDTGRPYFVMELVKGVPITEYCDANKLSTRERLELFMQVCQAVQHAHQKGVIHRDLKPSNVLVTVQDDRPIPKVIDFGIAKATQARLTEKTVFTRFHQWIGTPAYMSPEQAGLGNLDVDTRSDVYSLGVLLYELLIGQTPFDAQKLLASGYDAVLQTIREEDPPKPSTRLSTLAREELNAVAGKRSAEPGKLGRVVRGDLDWIAMKCLEKDRQRRYETPGALAQDVARHMNCQPVLASPPSAVYRVAKFVRRNRIGVSFVSLLALALIIGLGSTLLALKRARQERDRAEAAATIATTINDFVQFTMADNLGEPAGTNAQLASRAMLEQLAGNIERQFANRPLVEAAVRLALGRTYLSLGEYSVAERHVQRAAEIREKELGPEQPATLEALGALGFLRFKQGNPAQAETLLRRVLEVQRRVLGQSDPATIQTLVILGAVQRPGGGGLTPELLKAIKSLRNGDARTLGALHLVVDTLRDEKRLLEAETLGRELLTRDERILGSNHTETVKALICLSYTVEDLHRTAECEQLVREAVRRGRQSHPTGPTTADAFRQLLELVTERGDYDEAQRLLEEELGIEKDLLGDGHETTQLTQRALSKVVQQKASAAAKDSQRRQQLALAEEKLRLEEANGGAWLQRALARAELRQWDLAGEDLDQALARTNTANAAQTADFALACLKLARYALPAAQHKTAERASSEAARLFKRLEQEEPKQPMHALWAGKSLWQLGDVLRAAQRDAEAKQVLHEALRVFEQGTARCPEAPELRQEQAFSHRKIGVFYESAGKSEEAEAQFRSAIALYAALKKEFPTNTFYAQEEAYTTWTLAKVLGRAAQLDAAEAAYRQAVSLHEKAIADSPGQLELKARLRAIRLGLATLLDMQGKTAQADALRLREPQDAASPTSRPEEQESSGKL